MGVSIIFQKNLINEQVVVFLIWNELLPNVETLKNVSEQSLSAMTNLESGMKFDEADL